MFNSDFTKMFDPTTYAQNMQKMWDASQAMNAGKQNMEVIKKVGTIIADTVSTSSEKQAKYAQAAVEDCIEAMRELATCKGVEEYVQKQAQICQKAAEKSQAVAQECALQWQKAQSQCTDLIGKQLMQGMEWSKSFTTGNGKA